MTSEQRQKRTQISAEEKWNLEVIFKTEADFEAGLATIDNKVQTVLAYKGKLGQDATTLLGAIKALEKIKQDMQK